MPSPDTSSAQPLEVRKMRYQDFIAEVRNLIEEAHQIGKSGATHEDPPFREWRHRSESLVNEVLGLGYRLPGKFESARRPYRAMYSGASRQDNARALAKELGDSEIELRHFVTQYEKFGEPKSIQVVVEHHREVDVPERVTFAWLFRNVSVGVWASAIGCVIGAFVLGVAVARTGPYEALEEWIRSVLAAL